MVQPKGGGAAGGHEARPAVHLQVAGCCVSKWHLSCSTAHNGEWRVALKCSTSVLQVSTSCGTVCLLLPVPGTAFQGVPLTVCVHWGCQATEAAVATCSYSCMHGAAVGVCKPQLNASSHSVRQFCSPFRKVNSGTIAQKRQ